MYLHKKSKLLACFIFRVYRCIRQSFFNTWFVRKEVIVINVKKFVIWLLSGAIIALMLCFPNKAMSYVRDSAELCFEMIIPTLFPFFVCSGVLVYSGFCEFSAKLFRFCMMPLFRVNPAGAAAFVLGIVSGYPLGAVTAGQLYENGYLTKTEAERLCAFCNNSGPLFIIGSVGTAVYGNIGTGIMIYVLHILASITVGMIFRFYKKNSYTAPSSIMTSPGHGIGEIISISLNNAVNTILTVCGAIIFFGTAGFLVLDLIPLNSIVYAIATGIIEFANGTASISKLDIETSTKLILTAFTIGFAGLSVHAQVIAVIARYHISLLPYFAGKILHGMIAALYVFIYLTICPIEETVFAPSMSKAFFASSVYVMLPLSVAAISVFAIKINCYFRRRY